MLLLGDREVRECQEVTLSKDILSAGGHSRFNQTRDSDQWEELCLRSSILIGRLCSNPEALI